MKVSETFGVDHSVSDKGHLLAETSACVSPPIDGSLTYALRRGSI